MNKMSIKEYLFGYVIIKLPQNADKHLDMFIKNRIIFKTRNTDGNVKTIMVPYSEIKRIKSVSGDEYSNFEIKYCGLPKMIFKYKNRPGILAGIIIFALITGFFSFLVWDIEVVGNNELSDTYVLDTVKEYGLYKGVMRSSVDIDGLCQKIMINDGSIGWLSVNFRGTKAYVEVIEYGKEKKKDKSMNAQNIVAARDGRILEIDVYRGVAAVEAGDTVKAGDLLVSGIVESAESGYKLKKSEGRVIAEVEDTFKIEIPYTCTQNVYTGNTSREKSVFLFGREIKLLKNSGNVYDKCDIIKNIKRVELFDKIELPIEISEKLYNEYKETTVVISEKSAAEIAYKELEKYLIRLASEADITRKSIKSISTESAYVIEAQIYHTEEISKPMQISISKSG